MTALDSVLQRHLDYGCPFCIREHRPKKVSRWRKRWGCIDCRRWSGRRLYCRRCMP